VSLVQGLCLLSVECNDEHS